MLQITARLFKNNQLVGYQLTDGQEIQNTDRLLTWLYAKNKQILNVVATGSRTNLDLSGTNGFELKKLPDIQMMDLRNDKLGKYIEITALIMQKTGKNIRPRRKNCPIAYKIKNNSNTNIIVKQLNLVDNVSNEVQFVPGAEMIVSGIEIEFLAYYVGSEFANGKLVSNAGTSYISFNNQKTSSISLPKLFAEDILTPEEIKRFL